MFKLWKYMISSNDLILIYNVTLMWMTSSNTSKYHLQDSFTHLIPLGSKLSLTPPILIPLHEWHDIQKVNDNLLQTQSLWGVQNYRVVININSNIPYFVCLVCARYLTVTSWIGPMNHNAVVHSVMTLLSGGVYTSYQMSLFVGSNDSLLDLFTSLLHIFFLGITLL